MIQEVQGQEYGNDAKRRYAAGAASAGGGSGVSLRQNAVSALIPSPAFRAARSGVAEDDPTQGDQAKGIPLRHLDDAVQADIDVSP